MRLPGPPQGLERGAEEDLAALAGGDLPEMSDHLVEYIIRPNLFLAATTQ